MDLFLIWLCSKLGKLKIKEYIILNQEPNQPNVRAKLFSSDSISELVLEDELIKYLIAYEGVFKALDTNLDWHINSFTMVNVSADHLGEIFDLVIKVVIRLSSLARSVSVSTTSDGSDTNLDFRIHSSDLVFEKLDDRHYGKYKALVTDLGWKAIINDSRAFKSLCIRVNGGQQTPDGGNSAQRQIEKNNLLSIKQHTVVRDRYRPSILIVEPNPELCAFLKTLLSYDYDVLLAQSGTQSIELVSSLKPDIILCDVLLPKYDGLSLAIKLNKSAGLSHIPIIFMSGLKDIDTKLDYLSAGGVDYITKPFLAAELLLKIRNHLNVRYATFEAGMSGVHIPRLVSSGKQRDVQFKFKIDSVLHKRFNDQSFSMSELAAAVGMSDRQLQRKFKSIFNKTPNGYVLEFRTQRAFEMLSLGKQVSFVADICGFGSVSYFSKCFKNRFGVSPSECLKKTS